MNDYLKILGFLCRGSIINLLAYCWMMPLYGQNNGIYNGSGGSGYTNSVLSQVTNNAIFESGFDDGSDLAYYQQEINNGIFAGGADEGYEIAFNATTGSNFIFRGGTDDGYELQAVAMDNQGKIFSGGAADGVDLTFSYITSANGIFAGGNDDGYDRSGISKLTWTGLFSSDWSMADNWNVKRTPLTSDHVFIPARAGRYPLLTGKLLIGKSGACTYACKSLEIAFRADVTGNAAAWLENYGKIEVYGLLEFTAHPEHLIQNLGKGEIYIYTGGEFKILKD